MIYQENPYLVWQVIPGMILLGIGLYIQSREVKKRESNVFSLLMFGGAIWAFANAIQLITPNPYWQKIWNSISYLGIMTIPTAWFLLSVKLTGFARAPMERIEKWLWFIPAFLYLALLTSGIHKLFFVSFEIVNVGGYASLENNYGFLFYVHTIYSYVLMVLGILIMGGSLARNFKRYGVQAYGLIIGVLAPLIGNAYFLFGSPPDGFPDPTPIIFTVTGISFAWAIFGGHILEVVPLAHETIVRKLSTGVLILDADKNIRDINDSAREMLGLTSRTYLGASLAALVEKNRDVALIVNEALDSSMPGDGTLQINFPPTNRTFDVRISRVGDTLDHTTGWLIQFNDISDKKKAEENLVATQKTMKIVLDTLQDSFFEADEKGTITYANRAFIRNLGFTRWEDVQGKNFINFTDRDSVRALYEKFNLVYETKQPINPFEYNYRTRNGNILVGETTVSPIMDGDDVIGTRGIIRDVSERTKTDQVLRDAKEAAEARASELSAVNRLAATVSQSLDLEDILQSVCEELTTIFEIRNAGIGLLTPDRKSLKIVAFHAADPNEESVLGILLPVEGNTSSMEVLEKKRTVFIQDAQNDPRTSSIADISKTRGTRSIMIVPLLARGEAIGTIGMPAKDPGHIFSKAEIELAETIASQIAAAVDNAQLHARTESALDVAERDLEIGRQIQSGFFPETLPQIPGWEIATHFHAARQVAGDFYDVFQIKNSKFIAFVIADVCDKGVGAALFMVLFRSLIRAFSEVRTDVDNVKEQLLNIILNTSNFIADYHGRSNMFATMFVGILDPETGILNYVNGGHEPPVIFNLKGDIVQRLMPTGPAVGMFPGMGFRVNQVQLNEGDFFFGFTDGTTDAKNASGKRFSEERMMKAVAVPWTSIFSMIFELNVELQKHIGEQPQFDDITLLSFRRKAAADAGHHAICRVAHMDALQELRNFAESAAEHSGLKRDDVFAFKLAVDEICTNIIQYGFEGKDPGLLSLSFDVKEDTARLIVRDNGKHFPPEQAQSPDIEAGWEERQVGGLGIFFVKELMDQVTYNQTDEGVNQFILEKKIKNNKTK